MLLCVALSGAFPCLVRPFLFYGDGDHRDLHSFPTRRSSDLPDDLDAGLAQAVGELATTADSETVEALANRSEEHTSELQSRGHLVCRLLLEKKKKTDHTGPLQQLTRPQPPDSNRLPTRETHH